jgi:serine/threonine-protein kinase
MQQIGRYQLERELGRGSMGIVYAAFDPVLKRRVAIKTVLPDRDSSSQSWDVLVKRLAREAQSTAELSHPNIVGVYDVVEADGMFCVVMEFIDGKSLSQAFPAGSPVSAEFVMRMLWECAGALDHAHAHGLVHRDIKLANIMLDKSGVAKITDFGIAKHLNATSELTHGFAIGTLEYMSPEQLNAQPVDGRTDQYALAVVAYRLLTGFRTFDADSVGAWCHMLVNQAPTPPTLRNPALPAAVNAVLGRALAKNPQDRYESCSRFVEELGRALAAYSPTAESTMRMPIPPAEAGRGRGWRMWAALAVLAAVVGAGSYTIYTLVRRRAEVRLMPEAAQKAAEPTQAVAKEEKAAVPSPAPAPANPDPAREAWDRVKGTGNRASLEGFLKAYGNSEYANAARTELALLPPVTAEPGGAREASSAVRPGREKTNPKDSQHYVWIPPGKFTMGCSPGDNDCYGNEKPAHLVEITEGFWLGQMPVSIGPWKRYAMSTGAPPLSGKDKMGRKLNASMDDDSVPVVLIGWEQARTFCAWAGGRLPTEAEWEYAARAGTTGSRYGGLESIAWYNANSGQQHLDSAVLRGLDRKALEKTLFDNGNTPRDVGKKRPNAWNLYDMLGNAAQWTGDWYGESYYRQSPRRDPKGPPEGKDRVARGGSWFQGPTQIRVSNRIPIPKGVGRSDIGFRCVLE